jgi:hypothetical protein
VLYATAVGLIMRFLVRLGSLATVTCMISLL